MIEKLITIVIGFIIALSLLIYWEIRSENRDLIAEKSGWYRVFALYEDIWVVYWVKLAFLRDMDVACHTVEFPVRGNWDNEDTEVDIDTPDRYYVISRGRYYGRGNFQTTRKSKRHS